ncbi:MAG: hypothetical protein FD160_4000, partial [Caulobacteraceae bacterium]
NFVSDGSYVALVRATSDDGAKEYVGQYDFSVGEGAEWSAAFGVLSIVGAGCALAIRRRKRAAPRLLFGQDKSSPSALRQSR